MLNRRAMIVCAGAVGATLAISKSDLSSAAAGEGSRGLMFSVPKGSCDAHVHVIGNPKKFPMSAQRDYTPPPATADQLVTALRNIHCERVVIVTPTVYGADNSATLAAIETIGRSRARGIALVERNIPSRALKAMTGAGIAGVRLLLGDNDAVDRTGAERKLAEFFGITERSQCHIDISAPPDVTATLSRRLKESPVPLVFDYFGWLAGGVEQRGFDAIASLMSSGLAYVKLSEPYRLSKDPPNYDDLVPVVHALVAANPDRVLWGSGWPHVDSSAGRHGLARNLRISDKHLLNLFARWVPDPAMRTKILVENPARLYGFPS